ncbi:chitinase [Sporanaerobium hydrogeniformans]|uniref:Chitinase n=1 Tax=Sporanaerobium hydrogeniformans TaxID=3072179 RepID=A0AC61DFH1_9FIRM|nr:glycosyl hydrolase family 18 protein [Sporanaerobium hydrogeniformans]PHV71578.1 chitinase [Sporanaerobium hydrogeniformans]
MSHLLKLNVPAPPFTASSTQGLLQLSDYHGKWIVLLYSPASFSTLHKNQLLVLSKGQSLFQSKNTQLLGISADKNATHLTWYYTNTRSGNPPLPFPLIDDRQGKIGELYGIPENTDSSTQVFIIDPTGTLRASSSYTTFNFPQLKELIEKLENLQHTYRPPIQSEKNQPIGDNPNCDVTPIVGEYVLGNPNNVDGLLLDFVIYAFALINADGTLQVYSTRYLRELSNLRVENPELKVILAIGGWGADGFSDAALTPLSRYTFAREVQRWVNDYNLDGVDIDWEYPGTSVAGIKSRPEDKENFTLLLEALRDVLGPDAWLSVAGTGYPSYIQNVEIAKIAPIINYFNLMAYDFNAGETGPGAATHHSNLYPSSLSLSNVSVDNQVKNLEAAGMPSSQILMGIPFYGRYGASSTKTFDELRTNYINKNGYKVQWDNVAKAPYITDPSGDFAYGYDNLLSIYFKGLYVTDNCLGGMFAWQSSMDKANILTQGMSQAIRDISSLEDVLQKAYYDTSQ